MWLLNIHSKTVVINQRLQQPPLFWESFRNLAAGLNYYTVTTKDLPGPLPSAVQLLTRSSIMSWFLYTDFPSNPESNSRLITFQSSAGSGTCLHWRATAALHHQQVFWSGFVGYFSLWTQNQKKRLRFWGCGSLKGNFTHQVCLQFLGSTAAYWKKLHKAFCGSRGSCEKSDKLPQVMSLESGSVGKKSGVVELERSELTGPL